MLFPAPSCLCMSHRTRQAYPEHRPAKKSMKETPGGRPQSHYFILLRSKQILTAWAIFQLTAVSLTKSTKNKVRQLGWISPQPLALRTKRSRLMGMVGCHSFGSNESQSQQKLSQTTGYKLPESERAVFWLSTYLTQT